MVRTAYLVSRETGHVTCLWLPRTAECNESLQFALLAGDEFVEARSHHGLAALDGIISIDKGPVTMRRGRGRRDSASAINREARQAFAEQTVQHRNARGDHLHGSGSRAQPPVGAELIDRVLTNASGLITSSGIASGPSPYWGENVVGSAPTYPNMLTASANH